MPYDAVDSACDCALALELAVIDLTRAEAKRGEAYNRQNTANIWRSVYERRRCLSCDMGK